MLMPKKTKYRKQMKGRMKGTETRGVDFEFGRYALRALEPGWITSRQIEAARRAMTREIKRGGNVWIKIFPDKPITAKPAETRMPSEFDCFQIILMAAFNIFVNFSLCFVIIFYCY